MTPVAASPATDLARAAERYAAPPERARVGRTAFMIGFIGAAASALGAVLDPAQFYRSYLVAFVFWIGIPLGSLAIALLHHLTGGDWGLMARRILEAASRTLPWMAIGFLPILLGLGHLYLWARPDAVAGDALLEHKSPYLNPGAFTLRAAFYFVLLGGISFMMNRWSLAQDRGDDPSRRQRMRLLAGPGLAFYCLVVTFLGIDWLMSLDPHWFSSIYGVYVMGGYGLIALAFLIVAAHALAQRPPMADVLRPRHFGDYGNLMLAFLMLWGYFSISQLIIIWSANLPEEVPWYVARLRGEWGTVGLVLVVAHFALPFALLLSRTVKATGRYLRAVAIGVLVMRWVDLYWQAGPIFYPNHVRLHWLDLATVLAIGGLWTALFVRELGQRPLLPLGDPALPEAIAHD
jgi:hypothetical protein